MEWSTLAKSLERTLAIKTNYQNSPMVKIYYLPFLFIEYLEFSKMHYNLFNFELQIILGKTGFLFFTFYSFGKMASNGVFWVFSGKYWVMATM